MTLLTDIEARKLALEVARIAGVKCPSTSALTMLVRLVEAAVLTNQSEACIKQARDAALEEAASHLNILAMQAKRSMELGTEADDPSTWVTFDEAAAAIREMAKEMK